MAGVAEACKWHQKLSFVPGALSVVSAVAGTCVAGYILVALLVKSTGFCRQVCGGSLLMA